MQRQTYRIKPNTKLNEIIELSAPCSFPCIFSDTYAEAVARIEARTTYSRIVHAKIT